MRRLLPAILLVGAAAGCGHARLVHRTQYGGVYTLEGDRNKAMEDAHAQMSAHCRGPYTIVSEGEEVVGSDTSHGEETYVTEDGTVVKQSGASTRQATEWRIQYQCGTAQQPPPYGQQPPPYGQPGYPEQQPPPYAEQPGPPPGEEGPTSPPPPPPAGQY